MNKLLNEALRAKGYKGADIKMVLTDVTDPKGAYYTDTLTNTVVFDRNKLASANRDEILNALGHEFGHYSKADDIDKSQDIANYTGGLLEKRTKNLASKEVTEETLGAIRNNKNVIIGEEGKKLAESIPMDRREYYEAIATVGEASGGPGGVKGEVGVIYNKDPITGEEEFGYILGGQLSVGAIVPEGSVGLKVYEKEGAPIKDFQGFYGSVKGKIALYIRGEYELRIEKSEGKHDTNYGFGTPTIGFLGGIGYNKVFIRKNLSEKEKEFIRSVVNNRKSLENIEKTISELRNFKKVSEEITVQKIDLRTEAE